MAPSDHSFTFVPALIGFVLASLVLLCGVPVSDCSSWFATRFRSSTTARIAARSQLPALLSTSRGGGIQPGVATSLEILRGGEGDVQGIDATTQEVEEEDDEERYSRQVYTLGQRAHSLIRSSVVYLDGPAASGLVFETAKNLALSGIRHVVLVVPDDNTNDATTSTAGDDDDALPSAAQIDGQQDSVYHNSKLDDLGEAYQRAARAELNASPETSESEQLLLEYIKRLNPSVLVSSISRTKLSVGVSSLEEQQDGRRILVALDRPFSTASALNTVAREQQMAFVSVETAGVFARIFCDFGDSFQVFDADGETPLVTPLDRIEALDEDKVEHHDNLVAVHCIDGEKHDVSKGDEIQFLYRNGELSEERCIVERVYTPFRFTARMKKSFNDAISSSREELITKLNDQAAAFTRVKVPQTIHFVPLAEAEHSLSEKELQEDVLFTPCDLDKSFDQVRRCATFACFQALDTFCQQELRLPTAGDREAFTTLFRQSSWRSQDFEDKKMKKQAKKHIRHFLHGCGAKFGPLQALFGAIGAQEILKAASGLYVPVQQFLLYDCDEILWTSSKANSKSQQPEEEMEGEDPSTPGLRLILGDVVVDRLQEKSLFVVGAGAIGCEILKNLAALGVATQGEGNIILTDMDTIEKSNLSRQLLFRNSDLGKFKSAAAQEATRRFNPRTRVEAHSSKVGVSDQQSPFDDEFWAKRVDIVLNALDNVDARVYMDGQCVANEKALVDAGTMGPKGNVQTVVPHQSESYSSSADPPEEGIPLCTLKNFPYAISHTIQWGRDLFDGMFERRPSQANDYAHSMGSYSIGEICGKLVRDVGEEAALRMAEELAEDLSFPADEQNASKTIRQKALDWAAKLATKLYSDAVDDLLQQHPLDSQDEDGEPFWSGTRRPPQRLTYTSDPATPEQDNINRNLIDFVINAARLRAETFLPDRENTRFSVDDARRSLELVYSSCSREESSGDVSSQSAHEEIKARLKGIVSSPLPLQIAEFEKDDEANGHVAFVTAASNLRAICYGIPPVDAMETRRVAGNIVPAMITTTAFVSALSCIELIKLVQDSPLKIYRNAFVNLALPFFAFTVPMPAENLPGLQGRQYTLWDRLSVHESKKAAKGGGIKIRTLLKRLKKLASDEPKNVDVASISFGPFLIYANFLHADDEEVLASSLWELLKQAVESDDEDADRDGRDAVQAPSYSDAQKSVPLTVVVEDSGTGEEVELPPVRVERYKT